MENSFGPSWSITWSWFKFGWKLRHKLVCQQIFSLIWEELIFYSNLTATTNDNVSSGSWKIELLWKILVISAYVTTLDLLYSETLVILVLLKILLSKETPRLTRYYQKPFSRLYIINFAVFVIKILCFSLVEFSAECKFLECFEPSDIHFCEPNSEYWGD